VVTAPVAGSLLRFVTTHVRKSGWLIAAAVLVVAVLAVALYQPATGRIWRGKTTLTIGLAPSSDFILQGNGAPLTPIETPRDVVAWMSDPGSRRKIANEATFEPATAAFSTAMVASTLRGIVLENGRDVAVELSAGSAADVQAALLALAGEIGQRHNDILSRQLRLLRARIDENANRIELIQKFLGLLNRRALENPYSTASKPPPVLPNSISLWSELQERIQSDTNLVQLSEQTVVHAAPDTYFVASHSLEPLRASIVTGILLLVAMTVLTIVVNSPVRASAE
jgi:hypothetical protein